MKQQYYQLVMIILSTNEKALPQLYYSRQMTLRQSGVSGYFELVGGIIWFHNYYNY